jgi:uncharacterized SAM-binding protein YcdF (DUF218 family)
MFFILSKILSFLLSPLFLALIITVISFFVKRKRKMLQLIALATVVIFSNPFLFRKTVNWWEGDFISPSLTGNESAVVVLGGYCSYNDVYNRIRFSQSSDRLMQALMIHYKHDLPLVLAGGTANIIISERPEALIVRDYLVAIGLKRETILVDSLSRNTYENSVRTAALFDSSGRIKNIVLVTSSWHMYRAVKCFEKQGFTVTPYCADPLVGVEKPGFNDYFVPSASVLSSWELLFREWIGVAVYYLKGYV